MSDSADILGRTSWIIDADLSELDRELSKAETLTARYTAKLKDLDQEWKRGEMTADQYYAAINPIQAKLQALADKHRDLERAIEGAVAANRTQIGTLNQAAIATHQLNTAMGGIADGAARSRTGMLQLAYVADDIRYGFSSIVNNIPGLIAGFGGGAGLAGAIGLAAVGASVLVSHWDDLKGAFGEAKTETEAEKMEALTKATERTADQQRKLNDYKREQSIIDENKKSLPKEVQEHEKAVKAAIAELPNDKLEEGLFNAILKGKGQDKANTLSFRAFANPEEQDKIANIETLTKFHPLGVISKDQAKRAGRVGIANVLEDTRTRELETARKAAAKMAADAAKDPKQLKALIARIRANPGLFPEGTADRLEEATAEGRDLTERIKKDEKKNEELTRKRKAREEAEKKKKQHEDDKASDEYFQAQIKAEEDAIEYYEKGKEIEAKEGKQAGEKAKQEQDTKLKRTVSENKAEQKPFIDAELRKAARRGDTPEEVADALTKKVEGRLRSVPEQIRAAVARAIVEEESRKFSAKLDGDQFNVNTVVNVAGKRGPGEGIGLRNAAGGFVDRLPAGAAPAGIPQIPGFNPGGPGLRLPPAGSGLSIGLDAALEPFRNGFVPDTAAGRARLQALLRRAQNEMRRRAGAAGRAERARRRRRGGGPAGAAGIREAERFDRNNGVDDAQAAPLEQFDFGPKEGAFIEEDESRRRRGLHELPPPDAVIEERGDRKGARGAGDQADLGRQMLDLDEKMVGLQERMAEALDQLATRGVAGFAV